MREIEKSKNEDKQQTAGDRFIVQLKKLELEYTEASKNNLYTSIDGYIDILWMQIVKIFQSKNAPKTKLCAPIAKFLYGIQAKQKQAEKHPDNYKILKHINKTVMNLIAFCLKTKEIELMQELISEEDQKLKGFKNYLQKLIEDDEGKILEDTEQSMRQDGLSLVENIQEMLKKTQDEPTIRFLNQVKDRLNNRGCEGALSL